MLRKFILSTLAALILIFSVAPKVALAQAGGGGVWYKQSFSDWFTKVDGSPENEIFGERYTAAQVQWVFYGLFYFILNNATNGGTDALSCLMTKKAEECEDLIKNLKTSALPNQVQPPQAVGSAAIFVKTISSSPISLSAYLRDVGSHLGLVSNVSAQSPGFGFGQINAALALWKIFRNLSYALLVLVITAMAFMIMFRVKISPQTVITVQSALPKVVITLILITFSYAIAGFLIDIMYVVIGLISGFIAGNFTTWNWGQVFTALTVGNNVFDLFMTYWQAFLAGAFINIFSAAGVASFFVWIFAIFAFFILLWYSIKVIFLLLKTYIQIMLLVIFAPFMILLGAIVPGMGFSSWLKSMAANLAVYPFVGLMFTLALVFVRAGLPDWFPLFVKFPFEIKPGFLVGAPWDPPLTFGTGGTSTSHLLWIVVSFGIIALIPKVADIIQGFISGKPLAYGTAIGESIQGPPTKIGAAIGAGYVGARIEAGGLRMQGWRKTYMSILQNLLMQASRGGR